MTVIVEAIYVVVPAKAGTHNHRTQFGEDLELSASFDLFLSGI
jgi:hypothetical protein